MYELDIIGTISALELVLAEVGWNVQPGSGVMAAQQAFSQ
jgi:aspartate aminotransferase-like enzyme